MISLKIHIVIYSNLHVTGKYVGNIIFKKKGDVMRRPNKSGSVIKLSGKRRRPYAVRIYKGLEEKNGKAVNKYEYLEYFEKSADALAYLEKYNTSPVEIAKTKEKDKKHRFSEVYDMWIDELSRRSKPLSNQTYSSYSAAYKKLSKFHNMVFENITLEDLESEVLNYKYMSLSTITNIKIVLKGMYKTAMRHKYVNEDISALLILEHNNENKRPHTIFTDEEIEILWNHKEELYPRILLILIYTGMRVSELLTLKTDHVHIDDRYMVGGIKTEAGTDRIIPIHERIVPLFDVSGAYLFYKEGRKLNYQTARIDLVDVMRDLGMEHTFHDTRHTCATLMERAGISSLHRKLILGHTVNDITDGVYTHVSKESLIQSINRL